MQIKPFFLTLNTTCVLFSFICICSTTYFSRCWMGYLFWFSPKHDLSIIPVTHGRAVLQQISSPNHPLSSRWLPELPTVLSHRTPIPAPELPSWGKWVLMTSEDMTSHGRSDLWGGRRSPDCRVGAAGPVPWRHQKHLPSSATTFVTSSMSSWSSETQRQVKTLSTNRWRSGVGGSRGLTNKCVQCNKFISKSLVRVSQGIQNRSQLKKCMSQGTHRVSHTIYVFRKVCLQLVSLSDHNKRQQSGKRKGNQNLN